MYDDTRSSSACVAFVTYQQLILAIKEMREGWIGFRERECEDEEDEESIYLKMSYGMLERFLILCFAVFPAYPSSYSGAAFHEP